MLRSERAVSDAKRRTASAWEGKEPSDDKKESFALACEREPEPTPNDIENNEMRMKVFRNFCFTSAN